MTKLKSKDGTAWLQFPDSLLPNGSVSTQSASLVIMGCGKEKGSHHVGSSVPTPSFSSITPVKKGQAIHGSYRGFPSLYKLGT